MYVERKGKHRISEKKLSIVHVILALSLVAMCCRFQTWIASNTLEEVNNMVIIPGCVMQIE